MLQPVFKDYFERLRRGKYLEPFQILPNQYLCAIDSIDRIIHLRCDNTSLKNIKTARFLTIVNHPHLMITEDALFSKGLIIKQVLAEDMNFLFVAKPNGLKYMMSWIAVFDSLPQIVSAGGNGRLSYILHVKDL